MWQIYSFKNEKKIDFEPGACTGGSQGPKGPPLNLLGGAKGGGPEIGFFRGMILWSNFNIHVLVGIPLVRQGRINNFLTY